MKGTDRTAITEYWRPVHCGIVNFDGGVKLDGKATDSLGNNAVLEAQKGETDLLKNNIALGVPNEGSIVGHRLGDWK
jgi:hypothetical protein